MFFSAVLIVTGMVLETFLGWGQKIVDYAKKKIQENKQRQNAQK